MNLRKNILNIYVQSEIFFIHLWYFLGNNYLYYFSIVSPFSIYDSWSGCLKKKIRTNSYFITQRMVNNSIVLFRNITRDVEIYIQMYCLWWYSFYFSEPSKKILFDFNLCTLLLKNIDSPNTDFRPELK